MNSFDISNNPYLNNLSNLNFLFSNTVDSLRSLSFEGCELTVDKVSTLDMSKISPQIEEINLEDNPQLAELQFLVPFFEANKDSNIQTIKISSVNFEMAHFLAKYRS